MASARNLRVVEQPPPRPDGEVIVRPHVVPPALYATLAAVDISSFGLLGDAHSQLHQRHQMYTRLAEACEITRIPWWDCYRHDRGDGALIIAPPDVPADDFLDPFAHHLTAVLRRSNRLASSAARLRLRVAVHAGHVHRDAHGVAGPAVLHLFRLLESAAFKKAHADGAADLGLIVSDRLYGDATARGGLINPDAYRPLRVSCKETRAKAWLWSA
ncbi:hypothetical protein E1287_13780 [Actinomadura sp. KC06]|uniref:hypothetical protein n=1 Tax=Actinomadura sp. KC06 TaxID=2530369 RepID=UPI001047174D|nr:hypothetical protein [Actinomadura sp. KC06]TDD35452.1 hypothetical protein E1287_13780 [Actinomadura sp. KC06]